MVAAAVTLVVIFTFAGPITVASARSSDSSAKPVTLTLADGTQISLPAKMEGDWEDGGYSGDVIIRNFGNTGVNAFRGEFRFGGTDSKCDWFSDFVGSFIPTPEKVIVLKSNGCEETELKLWKVERGWYGTASWYGGVNEGTVQVK